MKHRTIVALVLIVAGVGLMLLGRHGGPNARLFLTIGLVSVVIGLTIVRQPGRRPPSA
jgi:hypothetical protein